MSRNTAAISKDDHFRWYSAALQSADKYILIGSVDQQNVGMVRFDRVVSATWEVSIVLASESRGKGISRPLLVKAIEYFLAANYQGKLLANIKTNNEASMRLFESAGFHKTFIDDGLALYSYSHANAKTLDNES